MRMRIFKGALLAGLLLFSSRGSTISRVGGQSVGSARTGFEADVAEGFDIGPTDDEGRLLLEGRPLLTGRWPQQQWIMVQDLDVQMPSIAGLSLTEMDAALSSRGYASEAAVNPCVRSWKKESPSSLLLILAWGPRQGVVLSGNATAGVRHALEEVRRTIRLRPGACGWN